MARIVPTSWMPGASMKRIHLHWTAGAHKANSTDKKAYHILVQGDGSLVQGKFSIKANEKNLKKGKYAAHTLNANSGAVGVSLCCMAGAKERPFKPGSHPMTKTQWDVGLQVLADLAERYNILVTNTTILTHAEVEPNLHIKQKNKWDIVRLAFDSSIKGHSAVGNEMRSQVAGLLGNSGASDDEVMGSDQKLPKYRVTGVAPSRLNFRRTPGGKKVGSLPERTVVERLGVDGEWWRVRTRLGYVGYVHSGFLTPK